ncbi:MAG: GDSL-type esterase/lipase family protein [Oscillospiraceae bacterium]|nr:GDSL-type esterase/lipase family protein [Oscillospiraceae bacterium]
MGEKRVFRASSPADSGEDQTGARRGPFKKEPADAAAQTSLSGEGGAVCDAPQQAGTAERGLFEVSEATIRVNKAARAGKRRLMDVESEVSSEADPFASLGPLVASKLPQEEAPRRSQDLVDTMELEIPKKQARADAKKSDRRPAGRKKAHRTAGTAGKSSLAGWLRKSPRNLALGIGAGIACLAILAGVGALCVRAIRNQTASQPADDTYVETLHIDPDEYADVLLAKTKDAGDGYIAETLFIGDSNTARLSMYGYLTLDNVIGIESLGIEDVTTSKCVYFSGYDNPVTIPEAVKMMKPRRIILNFGTNNIMWNDTNRFIEEYGKSLAAVRAAYPYSDIIISAIPPLGSNRSNQKLTMEIVDAYNLALLDFAKEKGLTFLNISETLKGDNGWMRTDYVIEDGIHLSKTALEALLRYVRTHSHVVDDARPKPLGDIPARRAAPVIETDKEEFDPDTVVSLAYDLFKEDGFSRITDSDDLTDAVRLEYAIPSETEAGEEKNVAGYFYNFVLKQLTYKQAKIQLSGEKKDTTYSFYAVVIPKLCETHTYDQGKITLAATCVTDGVMTYTCTVCGYQKTEVIPALGHDYLEITENRTDATCGKDGQRVYVCQRPSCTESTQGHVKTEVIPATGQHTVTTWTVKTAATCGKAGVEEGVCTVCGKTIQREIPATGQHTWVSDGQGKDTCSVCGATRDTPGYVPPETPATP